MQTKHCDDEGGGASRGGPLYERLPHGPHRLDRREVLMHQRARIHGAMVEAVVRGGYGETGVKQVTGLAGVSRRAFYEQFANREDCFVATFDMLAGRGIQRIRRAYLATDGPLQQRLGAAFRELEETAGEDRKAAALVAVEAHCAGRAGIARVRAATARGEQLLAGCFAQAPEARPLPAPIVRGIAGGLQGAVSAALRAAPAAREGELAEALLRFTLSFQREPVEGLAERLAAVAAPRLRELAARTVAAGSRGVAGSTAEGGERAGGGERELLLGAALGLAVLGDYPEITAPQIADEAGVEIESFFALFADPAECYAAALETVAEGLLAIAGEPQLRGSDWPCAVRDVIDRLLEHLAREPLRAHTIAAGAFAAGREAATRNLELAGSLGELLTAGAPGGPPGRLASEAVAGAIWHTVGCQAARGRVALLPVLADHLAFVVLAPFVGAREAAEVLTAERPLSGVCG
jgi:TetR/AcrR family transcriptional regulator